MPRGGQPNAKKRMVQAYTHAVNDIVRTSVSAQARRLIKRYKKWTTVNATHTLISLRSMVYSIRSSPIYACVFIIKTLPCDIRVTFVCQLTTRFLSDAAQMSKRWWRGQWCKNNQVAADAGLKTQVTVFHFPLRPGRRRWLAQSRKYEVRTCLAAGVIAAA